MKGMNRSFDAKKIVLYVVRKSYLLCICLFVLDLATAFIPFLTAWVFKTLLESLSVDVIFNMLMILVTLLSLFSFLGSLFSTLRGLFIDMLGRKTRSLLTRNLMIHVRSKPLIQFEKEDKYAEMVKAKETVDFFVKFVDALSGSMRMITLSTTFAFALWTIDPIIALLTLVIGVPALYFSGKVSSIEFKVQQDQHSRQRIVDYIADLLIKPGSAKESKLFASSHFLIRRWGNLSQSLVKENLKISLKTTLLELTVMVAGLLVFFVTLIRLVYTLDQPGQKLSGMTLVALIPFAVSVFQTIQNGQSDVKTLVKAIHEWKIYRNILVHSASDKYESNTITEKTNPLVELNAVSFKYPDKEHWILKDIELSISEGETVALVGENGSGKSTLAKLIAGIYSPSSGDIRVMGKSTAGWSRLRLRKYISFVFQQPIRYPLSLKENITMKFSDNGNSEKLMERFGLKTQLDNEARLGIGFKGGINLSGGQWQMVSMARAFTKPNVMLFIVDEPTSSMDPETEVEAFRFFRNNTAGAASIIISHRLGFAREADRILFLKDGSIAETGPHEELIELGGGYASLYESQSSWYKGVQG